MKKSTRNIIALVINIAIIAILGIAMYLHFNKKANIPETPVVIDTRATQISEVDKVKDKVKDRNVYFAGIDNAVLDMESRVKLENLPENEDFYMSYTVTNDDTGEVVYNTDLIPSGSHVAWIAGETLGKGEFNLSFLATPYVISDEGEAIALTSGNNKVKLTIQ